MLARASSGGEYALPPWAVKVISTIGVALLSAFVAWMVNVSQKLSSMESQHVELRSNLEAMERRMELQLNLENRRYEEIKTDLRAFMDRVDLKIDKLLSQRTGSQAP